MDMDKCCKYLSWEIMELLFPRTFAPKKESSIDEIFAPGTFAPAAKVTAFHSPIQIMII